MSATPTVQPPPKTPTPEPSGTEVMAWLIQIARGLDWGWPLESEVAEPPNQHDPRSGKSPGRG